MPRGNDYTNRVCRLLKGHNRPGAGLTGSVAVLFLWLLIKVIRAHMFDYFALGVQMFLKEFPALEGVPSTWDAQGRGLGPLPPDDLKFSLFQSTAAKCHVSSAVLGMWKTLMGRVPSLQDP